MNYYADGAANRTITDTELRAALDNIFARLGPRKRILIIPPDMTRYHSRAGKITEMIWEHYGTAVKAIMPALGTHYPMTKPELKKMFGSVPSELFRVHDWRNDVLTLGELPAEYIEEISGGNVSYSWKVQVNRLLVEGDFDLILSVGQVVPHEVIGMANYTKNICVGTGGSESINKSHFLGAACNMETILGRTDNPVRTAIDAAFNRFAAHLPVVFIQTVIGSNSDGEPTLRGLYAADDRSCFEQAAELSREINITLLRQPPETMVVYLDPEEFKSTWLGNKSIYRTRMALADGGNLIVLAPGVASFGEDAAIDLLIRKYGYCGTPRVLKLAADEEDLRENLAAAAHLIHGSTEGRFTVTYCTGGLSREEIEAAGYQFGDIDEMLQRYQPAGKLDGYYEHDGESYYFIANPALGLWAAEERFNKELTYTTGIPRKERSAEMNVQADIGLIGLAVMGQNLVLNMNDHGYSVAVFNRTTSKVDEFLADAAAGRETIYGTYGIEELAASLKRPRKVMLMVKAGAVVDVFIDMLLPCLEEGDIIIDGGNSHFPDTTRRTRELAKKGILFIGTGVSGGEEGARRGPSIMPGGNAKAWPAVKEILQAISAKTEDGEACCDWVGAEGAGHYVKMVHNGIEYGDMQLIAEAYQLMHEGLGLSHAEMETIFSEWNEGELDSYLIEITRDIMGYKDEDGEPLVEKILDTAGQKGTGKWTGISSLELGVPVTLIGEAVFARALSYMKDERVSSAKTLRAEGTRPFVGDKSAFVEDIRQALLAAKIVSYAQGYMLMREAARENGWDLNYGGIALMWRGGCIIRSVFLGKIKDAFDKNPTLENLLVDDYFHAVIDRCQSSWRKVVIKAVELGIPAPALTSALTFFDGYRSARLPANLLQAQRDYFGAHTYERIDRPRGEFFHTNWTGTGGNVASGTYEA